MFELVASKHLEYTDNYNEETGLHAKDRVALMVLLRARISGDCVCFVSTHLARNPENLNLDRLRARQIGQLIRALSTFIIEQHAYTASVVLTGDLNAQSFSRLRGIAMTATLLREDTFVHPVMFDCCDVPTGATSVTSNRNMRIDAILYQSRRLELIDATDPNDERTNGSDGVPIPNGEHPSDHIPVTATFRVRSRLQRGHKTACEWYLRLAGRNCFIPLNLDQLREVYEFVNHGRREHLLLTELRGSICSMLGPGVGDPEEVTRVIDKLRPETATDEEGLVSIDAEGFAEAYCRAVAKEGMPQLQDFKEAFKSFDCDGSGELNMDETLSMFSECCPTDIPREKLAKLFQIIDADSNGCINLNEFCAHMSNVWNSKFAKRSKPRCRLSITLNQC